MNVGGDDRRMSAQPFASRPSCVQSSPAKQGSSAPHRLRRGFCCGLNDCISMGSKVSTGHHQHQQTSVSRLQQQVEELEKEVQMEKELRTMYRKRLERTQDYLRYCLQTAKDSGFLQLIIRHKHDDEEHSNNNDNNNATDNNNISSNNNSNQREEVLVSPQFSNGNVSPQLPTITLVQPESDISIVVDQARINGWYIEPHEIELQEKIARGTTAEIYRAVWRGLDVAVKCIFPDFFHTNQSGAAFFAQELETLSRQRHRFVLQLMGACIDPPERAWIVTEFLGSTLKEWLHGPGNRRTGERVEPLPPLGERLSLALEIAQAMEYLHEQKPRVIHRDLKPSNIFLDDAMHVRVADFGHARFLADDELALTGETGTYVYMAPEVIRCEPYDEKCDVYSFGVILNELVTGEHPYIETEFGPAQIAVEVAEGKLRPALPDDEDGHLEELVQLVCLSWDQDPSIRPHFSSITRNLKVIKQTLTENA
ncbi:serine/threonine-protein kinase VIK-like [Syzygium oleosum]|uniref:serine/threonine-protein kinase VIK-like n=1 Tax=Syzygium oleosum TaxID=219896 RepID=UPI0024B9704B|nr:serine/threonine-protein kinase VIK-like [Syzygium oleosum]